MKTCKGCIHYEVCQSWNADFIKHRINMGDGCVCEHFKDKARYIELTDDVIFILTAIAWGCSSNEALSPCATYHVDNELLGNRKILISEALYQFDKLLIEIAEGRTPSRREGKWKKRGNEKTCSLCKFIYYSNNDEWNYCPNCGAKMKGGAE